MYKKSNTFGNNLISIYNKNSEAIQIIFEYNLVNFPIDIPDKNNNTILHHVVLQDDSKTLSLILNYILYENLDYSSLINFQNNDGDTAMHIAVRDNNTSCAKMLHKAGTNLSITNNKGESIEVEDNSPQNNRSNFIDSILGKNKTKPRSYKNHDENNNEEVTLFTSDCNSNNIDIFEKTENTEIDTNKFLRTLLSRLDRSSMIGGKKKKKYTKSSKRTLKSKIKRSKNAKSPSDLAHEEVINKAQSELGMPEEDARAFKSGLYKLVKTQFPDLGSKARSQKMLELMKDKKVIKDIKANLGEIKKVIAEHRKQKEAAKQKE